MPFMKWFFNLEEILRFSWKWSLVLSFEVFEEMTIFSFYSFKSVLVWMPQNISNWRNVPWLNSNYEVVPSFYENLSSFSKLVRCENKRTIILKRSQKNTVLVLEILFVTYFFLSSCHDEQETTMIWFSLLSRDKLPVTWKRYRKDSLHSFLILSSWLL